MRSKRTREIAPRLADGRCRDQFGTRFPPDVKAGLKAIARQENRSVSWVIENVIIDFFHLPQPKYKKRKGPSR